MFKALLFNIFRMLPLDMQNEIAFRKQMLTKESVIEKWEKKGKPAPPPHIIKQLIIREYQASSRYKILVETGTYLGHMIETQKSIFDKVYSIELSPKYWKRAKQKFRNDANVVLIHGDSSEEMPNVLKDFNSPAIFWLDGHYSLGTAKGNLDCPIYGEIQAIFSDNDNNHILLIDDARDFNGTNDYPTISELKEYIELKRPNSSFEVKDDVIRIMLN